MSSTQRRNSLGVSSEHLATYETTRPKSRRERRPSVFDQSFPVDDGQGRTPPPVSALNASLSSQTISVLSRPAPASAETLLATTMRIAKTAETILAQVAAVSNGPDESSETGTDKKVITKDKLQQKRLESEAMAQASSEIDLTAEPYASLVENLSVQARKSLISRGILEDAPRQASAVTTLRHRLRSATAAPASNSSSSAAGDHLARSPSPGPGAPDTLLTAPIPPVLGKDPALSAALRIQRARVLAAAAATEGTAIDDGSRVPLAHSLTKANSLFPQGSPIAAQRLLQASRPNTAPIRTRRPLSSANPNPNNQPNNNPNNTTTRPLLVPSTIAEFRQTNKHYEEEEKSNILTNPNRSRYAKGELSKHLPRHLFSGVNLASSTERASLRDMQETELIMEELDRARYEGFTSDPRDSRLARLVTKKTGLRAQVVLVTPSHSLTAHPSSNQHSVGQHFTPLSTPLSTRLSTIVLEGSVQIAPLSSARSARSHLPRFPADQSTAQSPASAMDSFTTRQGEDAFVEAHLENSSVPPGTYDFTVAGVSLSSLTRDDVMQLLRAPPYVPTPGQLQQQREEWAAYREQKSTQAQISREQGAKERKEEIRRKAEREAIVRLRAQRTRQIQAFSKVLVLLRSYYAIGVLLNEERKKRVIEAAQNRAAFIIAGWMRNAMREIKRRRYRESEAYIERFLTAAALQRRSFIRRAAGMKIAWMMLQAQKLPPQVKVLRAYRRYTRALQTIRRFFISSRIVAAATFKVVNMLWDEVEGGLREEVGRSIAEALQTLSGDSVINQAHPKLGLYMRALGLASPAQVVQRVCEARGIRGVKAKGARRSDSEPSSGDAMVDILAALQSNAQGEDSLLASTTGSSNGKARSTSMFGNEGWSQPSQTVIAGIAKTAQSLGLAIPRINPQGHSPYVELVSGAISKYCLPPVPEHVRHTAIRAMLTHLRNEYRDSMSAWRTRKDALASWYQQQVRVTRLVQRLAWQGKSSEFVFDATGVPTPPPPPIRRHIPNRADMEMLVEKTVLAYYSRVGLSAKRVPAQLSTALQFTPSTPRSMDPVLDFPPAIPYQILATDPLKALPPPPAKPVGPLALPELFQRANLVPFQPPPPPRRRPERHNASQPAYNRRGSISHRRNSIQNAPGGIAGGTILRRPSVSNYRPGSSQPSQPSRPGSGRPLSRPGSTLGNRRTLPSIL